MGAPSPRPEPPDAGAESGADVGADVGAESGGQRGPGNHAAAAPASGHARYFIALRPSARARRALGALAASLSRRFGGRPIGEHDLHLTLAFIGTAPASVEPALRGSLATLDAPGSLTMAQLGHFGPRLLWIGPESPPPWLDGMVHTLRGELDRLGVAYDTRRFSPHLTLVRGARPIVAAALEEAGTTLAPIASGRMRVCVGASAGAPGPKRYRWLD